MPLIADSEHSIATALRRVGELLAADSQRLSVVVIGDAAMNLLGIVERSTKDVDILALGNNTPGSGGLPLREPPTPLPQPLLSAIQTVARDMNLEATWLNAGPALQWKQGLPPGLETRIDWRCYGGGLDVGVVARVDLIYFKLYAAADQTSTASVHFQDLLALRPTAQELANATAWVREQDASSEFHTVVDRVVDHAIRTALR